MVVPFSYSLSAIGVYKEIYKELCEGLGKKFVAGVSNGR